jgi:paraquat-inducible protein A
MSVPVRAEALGLIGCRTCGFVFPRTSALSGGRCIRCTSIVLSRLPRSAQNTLAWLLAGLILYVPANVLPVMYTAGLGGGQESTILSGVVSFWRAGSWDIAALIFIASVAVPATKFLALGVLLWTVRRRSRWASEQRTKLYRLVEFIGYWSMLDVVVVALTSALLQFKALGTAEPRLGIVFFCGVVVTTMIAVMSFDPRLLWDARDADAE